MFEDVAPSLDGTEWCLPGAERAASAALANAELREARRLVEQALSGDQGRLGDAQVLLDTKAVFELAARAQALGVRYLAEVDRRRLHQLEDSPTTTSWTRAQALPVSGAMVSVGPPRSASARRPSAPGASAACARP